MSEKLHSLHDQQDPGLSNEDRHLAQLLAFEDQKPWLLAFFDGIRDYFFPEKLPPLRVTSKPLAPKEVRAGVFVYSGAMQDESGPAAMSQRYKPGVKVDSSHLDGLASIGVEESGWGIFVRNVRDTIFPPKQKPLDVTSKPVQVKDIWGMSRGNERRAGLISGGVHVGAVALMFLVGAQYGMQEEELKDTVNLIAPDIDIAPYVPKTKPAAQQMGGGGGGGDRSPTPASKGKLPPVADRQFVPPAAVVHNPLPNW